MDRAGRFSELVRETIKQCDVFVCLLEKGTLNRDWVRTEIKIASDEDRPMIPIYIGNYEIEQDKILYEQEKYILDLFDYSGIRLVNDDDLGAINKLAKYVRQLYAKAREFDRPS